ncbi:MAG TPA: hypothetical protein VFY84_04800 [Jiangellales bacterium]|nr:hypothetical protein [Jiangellales bacterium]
MDDWEEWRRPGPARVFERGDVALTLAALAGSLAMTVLIDSMGLFVLGTAPSLPEQFLWGFAITAPLLVRRRFPATVVLWIAAVFIAGKMRPVADKLRPRARAVPRRLQPRCLGSQPGGGPLGAHRRHRDHARLSRAVNGPGVGRPVGGV